MPGIDHRQGIADMQAGDGTGRALQLLAVFARCERHHRPVGLFPHPRRQNTNHSLVPVGIKQRQPPGQPVLIQREVGQQILGLALHLPLDVATLTVEGIQLSGQPAGLIATICQQAGNAHAHIIQPAGGVEPRPHHKAQVGGADLGVIPPRHLQ